MTMLEDGLRRELSVFATLFRALSEPTRLEIVQHLTTGEHRVRDLVEHLGLAQSTVSAHLNCLRECGLVDYRAQGRSSWYRLVDQDGLETFLQATSQLLIGTSSRVESCAILNAKAGS